MREVHNDIEKYLKGELDAQAMHRLEKQALTDPFLAEALEGAETIESEVFSDNVKSLNLKIRDKTKKQSFIWPLRIAASLALVAVISIVVYTWEYPSKENLALSKKPTEPVPEKQAQEAEKDKMQPPEGAVFDQSHTEADGEAATRNSGAGVLAEKPTLKGDQADGVAEESIAEIVETPTAPNATASPQAQADDLVIAESKKTEQPVSDLLLDVAPAEEISIESLRGKRSAAVEDKTYEKSGEAQPERGYESLQDYLQQHIQYPKQALDNKTEGLVSILFIVTATGELTDFIVTQGIGNGCEEALIAAVKGIMWIPGKDENGKAVADSVMIKYQFILPR